MDVDRIQIGFFLVTCNIDRLVSTTPCQDPYSRPPILASPADPPKVVLARLGCVVNSFGAEQIGTPPTSLNLHR